MKRVTIMSRVNSVEQSKNSKTNIQLEELKNYCKMNNYEIVHVIDEHASGGSFDRPEWNQWLELTESRKLNTDLLLFTTWDRFSRNMIEAFNMIKNLRSIGITPQAIQQPLDFDIPNNDLMLSVYLAAPEVGFQRRSARIKEGIKRAKIERSNL